MFQNIYPVSSGHRFISICDCDSAKKAQSLEASFLMGVREISRLADLYTKGSKLILDTPSFELTQKIALLMNKAMLK